MKNEKASRFQKRSELINKNCAHNNDCVRRFIVCREWGENKSAVLTLPVNLEWPPVLVRTQLRTVFMLVAVIRNWVRLALLHPVIGFNIRANVSLQIV